MKKLILLIQIFSVFLLSSHVYATQIQLAQDNWKATFFAFDANGNGSFEHINDPMGLSTDYEDDDSRMAGQFNVNFLGQSTKGFCIDLTIGYANGDASITGLSGLANWGSVAWLLDNYWIDFTLNDTDYYFKMAALQMAVWDTIYGDRFKMSDYGLIATQDNFNVTRGYYDSYTGAIGQNTSTGNRYQILDFANSQDIIIKNPVPEPATMLLFGFGLLGLGAMGRKKE